MQPRANPAANTLWWTIASKELGQFFRVPIAWLFLAAFLLVTLFIFFWVEAFFARNIADVRPLFEWMPILLIFLSSALTMKMWSEERRSGTLEHVLTQPVPLWQFVLGKFLACWILLAIALLLTFPLPITVALLGQLDWGPVWSGYLAALLLGGAYLSMGLFISARCDNQIVSLILSVALAGFFYLVGAGVLTNLVNQQGADLLRSIGTGARFDSITRGVLDFRDLYYYLSLIAVFTTLNIFALERGRWAADGNRQHHNLWRWGTGLMVANLLFANVWLNQITGLRWDTTQGKIYSISQPTRNYLAQLQEPLLIRGYFSQKTHPLLAPLAPEIQNLLREYEVVGRGRVNVEILDPATRPDLEDEANSRYGIRPTPFRVADRHQASLVNSYFDILVQYGDEHQVLNFNDLIEVQARGAADIDVRLRNPEYDLTRAIRQVLYAYQSGGDLFESLQEPVTLTAYISDDTRLPSELVALREEIRVEAERLQADSGGLFQVRFVDPDAQGGAEGRRITEEYGFAPMAAGLLDPNQFFFYLTLAQGEQLLQMPLGDFTASEFRNNLQVGIRRFARGFTRTVALVVPEQADQQMARHMGREEPLKPVFHALRQWLGEDMNVIETDLSAGQIDASADIVVLAAPEVRGEVQRFAVDQFLMRGGTVVVATSPYSADMGRTSISLTRYDSGLSWWLEQMGVQIGDQLVMDSQNAAFPIPSLREVGGMRFQEMRMVDYPYFVDVRGNGLNSASPITADLPQITMPWASPIELLADAQPGVRATPLMHSSSNAWLGDRSQVMPNSALLQTGYQRQGEAQQHLLAVTLEGRFNSAFAGQPSPLAEALGATGDEAAEQHRPINSVLNHSADSARLVVFASNDLFRDQVASMLGAAQGGAYLNNLQLAVNTVDWALEDQGLLSIRSRSHFNRTLEPMSSGRQEFLEYLNYGLVLLGLLVIWLIYQYQNRVHFARYRAILAE